MKNGGLIPWDATVICKVSKTSWQIGEHLMNGDLEKHSKALSYRCQQWLKITLSLRKTSQGSTNLVRKFLPGICIGYALLVEGSWKGVILVADIEELENLEASESMLEDPMQRKKYAEER